MEERDYAAFLAELIVMCSSPLKMLMRVIAASIVHMNNACYEGFSCIHTHNHKALPGPLSCFLPTDYTSDLFVSLFRDKKVFN